MKLLLPALMSTWNWYKLHSFKIARKNSSHASNVGASSSKFFWFSLVLRLVVLVLSMVAILLLGDYDPVAAVALSFVPVHSALTLKTQDSLPRRITISPLRPLLILIRTDGVGGSCYLRTTA